MEVVSDTTPYVLHQGPHGHDYAILESEDYPPELSARPNEVGQEGPWPHPSVNDDGWYSPEDLPAGTKAALLYAIRNRKTMDEITIPEAGDHFDDEGVPE